MLYRALTQQAKVEPDKIAVVGESRSLSYGQLLKEVDECGAFLQRLNVKPETPVILGIPPSPEFYVVFYAACAIGATVIPVLPSAKIPSHIPKTGPLVAVGERSFLGSLQREWPNVSGTVVWDRNKGLHLPDFLRLFKRKGLIRKERVLAVSSSGTTGAPSLYYRPADMVFDGAILRIRLLGITSQDVLLSSRPYNNGSSINSHVILPVIAGCRVVVREKFGRFEASETIAREKVTVLYAVPFVFELLGSLPVSSPVDFSSLRLCVSVGAALSRYVYERFYCRFGIHIRQRYGASHIHPACAYNLSDIPEAVGQVSGPFPITILGDKGREVGSGMIGEIAFDLSKMARQWKRHLESNPNRRGKYLYTGYLGKTDAAGNVYIVGRKSRFIKVGGNRVEPAEVESVLRSHPLVREALVVPFRSGESDESVRAIVVPSLGLTSAEIRKHCTAHLEGYKCPRRIDFRKSLLRNLHGKVIGYG